MTQSAPDHLEETIAHLIRAYEDLSDIVADQSSRLERMERLVHQLRERAARSELDEGGTVPLADQRPPHW